MYLYFLIVIIVICHWLSHFSFLIFTELSQVNIHSSSD